MLFRPTRSKRICGNQLPDLTPITAAESAEEYNLAVLDALDNLGADYQVAAILESLDLPGLPVFLDPDPVPDVFIRVLDRDVILARGDVPTAPVAFPCTDVWTLRPGKPAGFSCCEAGDLSNAESLLYERIDVIFSLIPPLRVKANVLNNDPEDKTPSGLWPSDHATVVGRLFY